MCLVFMILDVLLQELVFAKIMFNSAVKIA